MLGQKNENGYRTRIPHCSNVQKKMVEIKYLYLLYIKDEI